MFCSSFKTNSIVFGLIAFFAVVLLTMNLSAKTDQTAETFSPQTLSPQTLSDSEMEQIAGGFVCRRPKNNYRGREPGNGGCNVNGGCFWGCGTDYTNYATTCSCTGAINDNNTSGCETYTSNTPSWVHVDCYCRLPFLVCDFRTATSTTYAVKCRSAGWCGTFH